MAEMNASTTEAAHLLEACIQGCKATFLYHSHEENHSAFQGKVENAMAAFHEAVLEIMDYIDERTRKDLSVFAMPLTEGFNKEKSEGIAILFQTLRRQLERICNPSKTVKNDSAGCSTMGSTHPFTRDNRDAVLALGRSQNHWSGNDRDFTRFISKIESNVYLAHEKGTSDIAAYALAREYKNHIELVDCIEDPRFKGKAKMSVLGSFNWWIPHHSRQQTYLTTRPLLETEKSEIDLYRENDFLAYGGVRDEKGALTHFKLGKLNDEFRTWKHV